MEMGTVVEGLNQHASRRGGALTACCLSCRKPSRLMKDEIEMRRARFFENARRTGEKPPLFNSKNKKRLRAHFHASNSRAGPRADQTKIQKKKGEKGPARPSEKPSWDT